MAPMASRARSTGLSAALLALTVAAPAAAIAPERTRPPVEATPAAKVAAPLRTIVRLAGEVPPVRQRAWDGFVASAGPRWRAAWDRATGVPSRIWGDAVHVAGANASPLVAETAARGFLAQHADLLAPGVDPADLELAANHDDGRIRTVAFWQRHRGLRVVGGQISVRFLNDRLYVVSSQIYPDVAVPAIAARAAGGDVVEAARVATRRDLALGAVGARPAGDEVIVPLVGDDAVLGYRVAAPVEVDAGHAGRWIVFADPATGEPLVRQDLVRRADGVIVLDAPVRWPGSGAGRRDYPAQRARVTVDGATATTGMDGRVSWPVEATVPVVTSVIGDLLFIRNTSAEDELEATADLTIAPAGTTRWSAAGDEAVDAQLATFVHAQIAKEYARAMVSDPRVIAELLDDGMRATVNIDDQCNAYYTRVNDRGTINFFASSSQCENTARIADVVYHEFGHGLHDFSIIPGAGLFDGAMSEGVSDFLSALITGDPGMGRGFFKNDEALRHLDEADEAVWPDDIGEIHTTGIIIGGAFWDLLQAARAALGDDAGLALTQRLFVGALQRSTDIPSALIEVLAADDDDGDLGNGTPNECLIREAFGRHGLRTVGATISAPGVVAGTTDATAAEVIVALDGLSEACLGDEVDRVEVHWAPRDSGGTPSIGSAALTAMEGGVWTGELALPEPGDVVAYTIDVTFGDGTSIRFPDNAGDPRYELYRGDVVELYCTDFERDPFAEGWTSGSENDRPDVWEWGAPNGIGGDPAEAYSGASVVGQRLGDSGLYEPDSNLWLRSPVIDVRTDEGMYSDVRLHYRRWLGVEDGFYDQATIYANGEIAWRNFDSGQSVSASTHTRDREWVFKDVSLSTRIYDGTVQLEFAMRSDVSPDGGSALEFGGWTLDDLCVVADPTAICGNGAVDGVEQCDDGAGNEDAADACRTNCRVAMCGDGIVDSLEQCDDGNRDQGDGCSEICTIPGEPGGCCSSSDDPRGALAATALVGLGLLAGRRRRARRS